MSWWSNLEHAVVNVITGKPAGPIRRKAQLSYPSQRADAVLRKFSFEDE